MGQGVTVDAARERPPHAHVVERPVVAECEVGDREAGAGHDRELRLGLDTVELERPRAVDAVDRGRLQLEPALRGVRCPAEDDGGSPRSRRRLAAGVLQDHVGARNPALDPVGACPGQRLRG